MPVLLSAKGVEPIVYSNSTLGGYAERMLLSAPLLLPIPNGLDPKHAALTEPMAVGLHAVNKSNIEPGETALVIGCGPIGIAIIAALRVRGVESIVAADFSPKRRELATAMGAHQVLDPAQGSPFDSVKASGGIRGGRGAGDHRRRLAAGAARDPAGRRRSVHAARRRAPVLRDRQRDQRAVRRSPTTPDEFAESLRALAEGEIDVAPMITGEVGLDGVGAAFDDLADPERHCKILVTP